MSLSNRASPSPFSAFSSTSPSPSASSSSSASHLGPSAASASSSDLANYPVLVTPNSLHFFPSPSGSWNVELLTVYNPLPFALQIKVLCTRAAAYAVDPSFCTIPPQSSMKLSVRMRSTVAEEQQRAEGRAKSKDKFMLEQLDAKGNVQNKIILTAHISTQAAAAHSLQPKTGISAASAGALTSSTAFTAASSAAVSSASSSSSISADHPARLWWVYLLTMPLRLFPLLLGILLIYCLNRGILQLSDPQGSLWLSFFVGFITCVIQLKFVESAKIL